MENRKNTFLLLVNTFFGNITIAKMKVVANGIQGYLITILSEIDVYSNFHLICMGTVKPIAGEASEGRTLIRNKLFKKAAKKLAIMTPTNADAATFRL